MPGVDRFDGEIAAFGTASGVRIVLGMWRRSPFGPFSDVMVEDRDGQRTLIAPTEQVAGYVAGTYRFDRVRIEPVELTVDGASRRIGAATLEVAVRSGPRTAVGVALRCVPGPLARSRWWLRALDPVASRLRAGVHTVGTAGNDRREFYAARDEHLLIEASATFAGADLGGIRPVWPPVTFGFGSAPATPSLVAISTLIRTAG